MARYDGDGSWKQLVSDILSLKTGRSPKSGYSILIKPISLLQTGSLLAQSSGIPHMRGQNASYIVPHFYFNSKYSLSFYLEPSELSPQVTNYKGTTFSLRRVAKLYSKIVPRFIILVKGST